MPRLVFLLPLYGRRDEEPATWVLVGGGPSRPARAAEPPHPPGGYQVALDSEGPGEVKRVATSA